MENTKQNRYKTEYNGHLECHGCDNPKSDCRWQDRTMLYMYCENCVDPSRVHIMHYFQGADTKKNR
jgi:hypothetical protein